MSSVTVLHAVAIFSVFAVGLIAGQMLAIGRAKGSLRNNVSNMECFSVF